MPQFLFPPQLAESAPLSKLISLCEDDDWVATQKADGDRRLIVVRDGVLDVRNRNGEPTDLPHYVAKEFERLGGYAVFDGELMHGRGGIWLFDLPAATDRITNDSAYHNRRRILEGLIAQWRPGPHVRLLPAAFDTESKLALAHKVRVNGGEGIMFNHVNGKYLPSLRKHRNKDLLKVKYVSTVDCVVTGQAREGKNNLILGLFEPGKTDPAHVGVVTAEAGTGAKAVAAFEAWNGDERTRPVVEVTYLYASSDKGLLVQPTRPRLRVDKRPDECTIDQLRYVNKEIVSV